MQAIWPPCLKPGKNEQRLRASKKLAARALESQRCKVQRQQWATAGYSATHADARATARMRGTPLGPLFSHPPREGMNAMSPHAAEQVAALPVTGLAVGYTCTVKGK